MRECFQSGHSRSAAFPGVLPFLTSLTEATPEVIPIDLLHPKEMISEEGESQEQRATALWVYLCYQPALRTALHLQQPQPPAPKPYLSLPLLQAHPQDSQGILQRHSSALGKHLQCQRSVALGLQEGTKKSKGKRKRKGEPGSNICCCLLS